MSQSTRLTRGPKPNDLANASLAHLVTAAREAPRDVRDLAFHEIVRRFRANAQASAFYLVRDVGLAEDVAQEAFLEAYAQLAQLREPAAFPGWFRRIVFKQADRVRRRSVPPTVEFDEDVASTDDRPSPEAWTAIRESLAQVRDALGALPDHERDVIVLFYFANRSHAEIGEQLLLPISTVKKRLHDARRRLRPPLEQPPPAPSLLPASAPPQPLAGREALGLARLDTPEGRRALARFEPAEVAGALLQLSPDQQVEFLERSERLSEIVPCLPELGFTHTLRSVGLEDSGWLIEFASPEQRVAAVDLDCWKDGRVSPSRLFEWIDAAIEAGTEALIASFDDLDTELWILALHWMADFSIPGHGHSDEAIDPWDESDEIVRDGATADGVVFYECKSATHEERLHTILSTARIYVPSLYWDFVYGVLEESEKVCEEEARRWQRGRLNDLGFPDVERAMQVYRPLTAAEVPVVASLSPPLPSPSFVPERFARSALEGALRELPPERGAEIQAELFQLANALAVADRLPLSSGDAMEAALGKALEGVDRGLAVLREAQDRTPGEIADTTPIRELFRLGATRNEALRPPTTLGDLDEREAREAGFDWNQLDVWLEEVDQTLRTGEGPRR